MTTRVARNRVSHDYSLFNAISAVARDERPDGFTGEVSAEMRHQLEGKIQGLSSAGGVMIPATEIVASRLDTSTPGRGPEAIYVRPGFYAEARQPRPVVQRLGATIITDTLHPMRVLRETGLPTISWVSEDPEEDVEESAQSFGDFEPPVRTAMTTGSVTRHLEALSTPQLRPFVERAVRRAGATAIDIAALAGTGVDNQPRGLLHTSDVGLVEAGDPDGASLGWEHITALRAEVADADADLGPTAFLGTPRLRESLENTPELGAGGTRPIWRGNEMAGELALVSNTVPSDLTKGAGEDLHALIFGNWSSLIVQIVAFELLRDPYAQKKSGIVELTLFVHLAVALAHPESFAVILDADVS